MEITDNLSQLLRYNVMENSVVPVADEIHFASQLPADPKRPVPGGFKRRSDSPPEVEGCYMPSSCCSRWWNLLFPRPVR